MTNCEPIIYDGCHNSYSLESGENIFDEINNYDSGKMSPNVIESVESKENVKKGTSIWIL